MTFFRGEAERFPLFFLLKIRVEGQEANTPRPPQARTRNAPFYGDFMNEYIRKMMQSGCGYSMAVEMFYRHCEALTLPELGEEIHTSEGSEMERGICEL